MDKIKDKNTNVDVDYYIIDAAKTDPHLDIVTCPDGVRRLRLTNPVMMDLPIGSVVIKDANGIIQIVTADQFNEQYGAV